MRNQIFTYLILFLTILSTASVNSQPPSGKYQTVTVIVYNASGSPAANVPVYFAAVGAANIFLVAVSDSKGMARFKVGSMSSNREMIAQVNNATHKGYSVKLADNEKFQLVGNSQNTDTLPFYGKPTVRYEVANYTKFTTMEDVLREYVTPVVVKKVDRKPYPFVFDKLRRSPFDKDPLLLVNGIPVFDVQSIMGINPFRLISISVVDYRYFINGQVFDGIIDVVTRDYDIGDLDVPADVLVIKFQ